MKTWAAIFALALWAGQSWADQELTARVLEFNELTGWSQDDHNSALSVFTQTCPDLKSADWQSLCAIAQHTNDGKTFFESFFKPVHISDGSAPLFTGYFEPELVVSRTKTSKYRHPIYRAPDDLPKTGKWFTRQQLNDQGILTNRGLEIAWASDPVDVFFLQIQGSGRLRFSDGETLRIGYGGSNGHKYRSIGKELVRRGVFQDHQVSASVIKKWVGRNPSDGRALLNHNPSFVFFRELQVSHHKGPLGAMNRSLTPLRSVAIDPAFVPLGAPVWLDKSGEKPMRRLMIAQDTGSVIKGAQRADIFIGSGKTAGKEAAKIKDTGSIYVLLPIKRALTLLSEARK